MYIFKVSHWKSVPDFMQFPNLKKTENNSHKVGTVQIKVEYDHQKKKWLDEPEQYQVNSKFWITRIVNLFSVNLFPVQVNYT